MEAAGFVLLFFYPWGTLLGITLLILGWRRNYRTTCSACEATLPNKHATRCPTCKAALLSDKL